MFKLKHRYLDEAGEGDGSSGNGDDAGNKGESIGKEDFDTLQETVSTLAKSLEGLHAGFGEIKEGLTKPPEPAKKPEPKTLDVANLETMSRQEFASNLVETIVDTVKRELIEPVSQKVGTVEEKTAESTLKALVKEAEESHKDFWDWKPEILAKLKSSNGALTPKEAYVLCRNSDPTKAAELDKKYAEGGKKDDDEEEKKGGKKAFGGMAPGGSKTTPSQTMSRKEAADAAWEEVMQ